MKILKCVLCNNEMELIVNIFDGSIKVKCLCCGLTNNQKERKEPEVIIIKKRI